MISCRRGSKSGMACGSPAVNELTVPVLCLSYVSLVRAIDVKALRVLYLNYFKSAPFGFGLLREHGWVVSEIFGF